MICAKNRKIENIEIYMSFLQDIITNNNKYYINIFDSIINRCHELSMGVIDYTNVESSIFDIVSILHFNNIEYFRKIEINSISIINYIDILNFLKRDNI